MTPRTLLLAALLPLVVPAVALGDHVELFRSRGGEVSLLDRDLRSAFARANPQAPLPESRRRLPGADAAAFDWSTLIRRSHTFNQAVTPYCWAYSAITALEWNWSLRNGGAAPALAVQPLIDRSGVNDEGASAAVGFRLLLSHGTSTLQAYPHTGKPGPIQARIPTPYRAIAWGPVVSDGDIPTPAEIKRALLEHGPLVTAVNATALFKQYRGGVFKEHFKPVQGVRRTNHSVVIVGWDDRKGRGCWKIQNSWGPTWGEGGYMWIEYGCNSVGTNTLWVRAQATHYKLPANAHKLVGPDIRPFHDWARAKVVTVPQPVYAKVTLEEALKRQGDRVEVQMPVRAWATLGPGHLLLASTNDQREEKALLVLLPHSELSRFPIKDPKEPQRTYLGKQIRVRGVVHPCKFSLGTRMVIEVWDPGMLEMVE